MEHLLDGLQDPGSDDAHHDVDVVDEEEWLVHHSVGDVCEVIRQVEHGGEVVVGGLVKLLEQHHENCPSLGLVCSETGVQESVKSGWQLALLSPEAPDRPLHAPPGQDVLQLVGVSDALHELHVYEARVLLLDVLQLLVRRVADPLLGVSGHADEVGDDLDGVDEALAQDQLDHSQGRVTDLQGTQ